MEGDAVVGPVFYVGREEVLQVLNANRMIPWTFRGISGVDCC